MIKFTMREYHDFPQGRVLIGLPEFMSRLPMIHADVWAFRDMELVYVLPFGIDVQKFEQLSRDQVGGFRVDDADFKHFLENDFQVINGVIEGYCADQREPCILIECVDSSQWEIAVSSERLAIEIEAKGFRRQDKST